MKGFIKKRPVVLSFLLALLFAVLCFSAVACGKDQNGAGALTSESGFVVAGGDFEEGATLNATLVDKESEAYAQALAAIDGQGYDKTQPVYVFELSVEKDGVLVQPSGKVKVTVPVDEDVTGYEVLHIKSNDKIEKLALSYENGKATFETDGFSTFALVKKLTQGAYYTLYSSAKQVVPRGLHNGGTVRDEQGEDIAYISQKLAQNTEYTVFSHAYPDYYFLGWYDANGTVEDENGDENIADDVLLSAENSYTFTVRSNLNVYALYAYKTDVVEVKLSARYAEFSHKEGKPVTTLVAKGCPESERPNPENVSVTSVTAEGSESLNPSDVDCNLGGLDFDKAGRYEITYTHNRNSRASAKLVVEVVESGYDLKVSSPSSFSFRYNYNSFAEYDSTQKKYVYEAAQPQGRLVTLSAITQYKTHIYPFGGWYDEEDNLLSDELVYTFEMPSKPVTVVAKAGDAHDIKNLTVKCEYGGNIVDGFGNPMIGSYDFAAPTVIAYAANTVATFTAKATERYDFAGWYEVDRNAEKPICAEETIQYKVVYNQTIIAKFSEKQKSIELSSEVVEEEHIFDGKLTHTIGDATPDYANYQLYERTATDSYLPLDRNKYEVFGEVDFNKVGSYTVTYASLKDKGIKTTLTVVVIDKQDLQINYTKSRSHLEHEFNGKAVFVSRQDITVNGLPLTSFKENSKIWESIVPKWTDKATGKELNVKDADVTINGHIVKNFGGTNDKQTVGDEFCGPIMAGEYKFELLVNGNVAFTEHAKITAATFKKISAKDEFKTNEGSTWLNFELYYYTVVGVADGKYYVMQMPSVGSASVEAQAREVTPDGNGNVRLGGGNDFAFVNAKYYANYADQYTEFLTGYYGSYVVLSSDNSSSGLFGTPYIYRTGYTSVSGGNIYREYGTKYPYGNKVTFAEANGAATIYSPNNGETENDRLRLVKSGDSYVFTSVPADADTRESFEVFIYQSIIPTSENS